LSGLALGVDAGSALSVLALNAGSSSLKFGMYRVAGDAVTALFNSSVEFARAGGAEHATTFAQVCAALAQRQLRPDAIGHRIVHGGSELREHCLIDASVLDLLGLASAFAPLHGPRALALIRAASEAFPAVPQVACLDTAFHANLPDIARVLPLPYELLGSGIQRYGFHGISCESILRQLRADADAPVPRRLVIAHLGNGASVTAVLDGRSIDTSMGLTPTGGVMMGTRSGDLDPGVLLYLARERGHDAASLEELLDRRSGLAGVSGVGNDLRELHPAAAAGNARARLALAMFCQSVRKQVAAMIVALDGVDALVFTGGIGEHDALVRGEIVAGLRCVGVTPDRCRLLVLESREDDEIARQCAVILRRHGAG
jgi:acetate kinase